MTNVYEYTYRGSFYSQGITLIPEWMSNHMPSKEWDEIANTFPNFNGCTVEVWEWINNSMPYLMDVII